MRIHRLLLNLLLLAAASACACAEISSAQTRVPGTAGNAWVDTGITVTRGTLIRLSATGEVDAGPGRGVFGPEGTTLYPSRADFPSDSRHRYGLVARLTASLTDPHDELREDFAYGERTSYCSPFTARLWLTVNDNRPQDNAGEFLVTTTLATCDPGSNEVRRTRIHVTEAGGNPSGAEVYLDGRLMGTTDRDGNADFPGLAPGTRVVVRKRFLEHPSYKNNHRTGSTQNWSHRVYFTNLRVNDDGSLSPHVVTDPSAVQEVAVSGDAVLVGVHLVVSVEWDASAAELAAIRDGTILPFSQFLYNATDGQFFVEQVEVHDNAALWDDADTRIYANWSLRSRARRGGFLGNCGGCDGAFMHMSRGEREDVYAHEFGHYGLNVSDEYADGDPSVRCTGRLDDTAGPFGWNADNGGALASCLMWSQAPKLCSSHPDNPHARGTRQGDQDCWSRVLETFRDREGPGGFTRWRLHSPATRGAIVGMLPGIPVGAWLTRVTIDDRSAPGLCRPRDVIVTRADDGRPLAEAEVRVRTASGREIFQGRTLGDDPDTAENETGRITVTGVHVGDRIATSGGSILVASCPPARSDGMRAAKGSPSKTGDAQGPVEKLVVEPPPFALRVAVDFDPANGRARVRVRAEAELDGSPRVTATPAGANRGRKVTVRRDPSTKEFIGFLDQAALGGPLALEVTAVDTLGRHATETFAALISSPDPADESDVFSADGRISLTLPAGALPAKTRVSVGPGEVPPPPVKEGQVVVSGPFAIAASSPSSKQMVLRFQLPDRPGAKARPGHDGASGFDAKSFEIHRFDAATGQWELVGGVLFPDVAIVTLETARLGTYALIARPLT